MVSTIPTYIKEILTSAGYNTAFSLLQITEENFHRLEEFIEKNSRHIIDSIELYKNKKPFAFLPGHRDTIFGIKSEIQRLQEIKKQKINHANSKNVKKNVLTAADLKTSLVHQLTTCVAMAEWNFEWSTAISKMNVTPTENSTLAQCSIACPKCNIVISVRYNKTWKISNICKHVRTHTDKKTVQNQNSAAVSKVDKTTAEITDQTNDTNELAKELDIEVDFHQNMDLHSDDLIVFDPEKIDQYVYAEDNQ